MQAETGPEKEGRWGKTAFATVYNHHGSTPKTLGIFLQVGKDRRTTIVL